MTCDGTNGPQCLEPIEECQPIVQPTACAAPITFFPTVLSIGGHGIRGVAIADVNRDCFPDVVLARDAAQRVTQVLFSNSLGSFGEPTDYEGPGGGYLTVAADLDGNGWLDIITTTQNDDMLHVIYNHNLACFAPSVSTLNTQANPLGITSSDFDNDGHLDVAVVNSADSSISIYLGRAGPTFAEEIIVPAGPEPKYLASADFNGDGCADLLVTKNRYPVGVQVLTGACDGAFALNWEAQIGEQVPGRIAVSLAGLALGDINGDGLVDAAVTDHYQNNVYALFSNGDGSFGISAPQLVGDDPQGIVVADLNNDGFADIAVASRQERQVGVLLSDGNRNFLFNHLAVTDQPFQIAAADLDLDGDTDLVATHDAGKVIVLKNRCAD
jgi:hypothetical protein